MSPGWQEVLTALRSEHADQRIVNSLVESDVFDADEHRIWVSVKTHDARVFLTEKEQWLVIQPIADRILGAPREIIFEVLTSSESADDESTPSAPHHALQRRGGGTAVETDDGTIRNAATLFGRSLALQSQIAFIALVLGNNHDASCSHWKAYEHLLGQVSEAMQRFCLMLTGELE